MKNIECVFLDAYNTFLFLPEDTNPYYQLFKLCGINTLLELKEARDFALTNDLSFLELAKRYNAKDIENVKKIEILVKKELAQVELYHETLYVLSQLKRKGLKICVISNIASPYKEPLFNLNLFKFFDEMFLSCECGFKKPDKIFYHFACDQVKINPQKVLMVGNSLKSDFQGAINSGLNALLLNREEKEINVKNIKTLKELLKIL